MVYLLFIEQRKKIMNNFEDQNLPCSDCGVTFVFTSEEQEFYAQKGFSTPKRCGACRAARKQQSRRPERPRFEVTCSECGCATTVPFEPSNDKPVYCSDCYRARV